MLGHINIKFTLFLLSVLALSGCSNSLVVNAKFPKPVSEPIGITMGVVYSDELKNYTYEEKEDERSKWKIGIGEAHQTLFENVFEEMFANSQKLSTLEENSANLDLVLFPTISEFQYSSPRETHSKIYEVWIKYNMQVYTGNGDLVADWIMSAYGKTPSAFLKSREDAMNQAIVIALRDLGASLVSGFTKVPEVKSWLEQKRAPQSDDTDTFEDESSENQAALLTLNRNHNFN
ncbi:hypothetical protein [Sessilibacter corallicola]|uniref:DUF4136 domain-containing protein n=1 Tax=Sessilibacter corallicola TaxID=2904075 RepID=A0ABQ0A6K1_9GAMM